MEVVNNEFNIERINKLIEVPKGVLYTEDGRKVHIRDWKPKVCWNDAVAVEIEGLLSFSEEE